ncbi:MAG: glycosyltransferase family 39 protein [Actinobacteria bacterium]|nr:glycosyltransferase family 39 protein [Actinomycetota bacterium]
MIWIILVSSLILRLVSLNQSLWLDEAINILAVKNFSLSGLLTQYAVADFHPPGWLIILWFWGKLFGYSEIAMRIPSVFFGVATVYITYLIGKKLFSKRLGLIAALLLSINPLHIYYSQEARMYSLATLAVVINILILIKIVKKERVNLIFFILSNVLILLSDYVAYFIFPVEFIFLLLLKEKEFQKKWFIALVIALVLVSWWIPVFLSQLNVGAVASANLPAWKFIVGGFDFKTLPLTFVKFIIGRISLANKTIYYAILLPICSLFAYLLWNGIRKSNSFQKKLLITWIIIPPLIATLISLVVPVYNYFRVLFILPGFVILIAAGIFYFKNKLRVAFLVVVVLIEFICSLLYLFIPGYQREDWRGLVHSFQSIKPSIILFESSGTLPPFDYYAKGSLNAKGALKDFPAKDESSVSELEPLLKNKREVYLIDYLVQISDPNRLVAGKLTSLGYKEENTKNFNGVGFVYHYIKE